MILGSSYLGQVYLGQGYPNVLTTPTRLHTTDGLKRRSSVSVHSTDANKRKLTTVSHTTSANKRVAGILRTHTTDTNKRKVTTVTHSTDANKRKALTKTHTTDALKRKVNTVSHTTDALKRKANTVTHTTSGNKRKVNTVQHTTDALKRKLFTKTHTTDAFLRRTLTVLHTTDANKRRATTVYHTTDAFIRSGNQRLHSTDANKRKAIVVTHTTDALKRKTNIATHTTDALKRKLTLKVHAADALKRKQNTGTHTTDAQVLFARRINMIPNPTFDGGVSYWNLYAATHSWDNTQGYYGSTSTLVTSTGSDGGIYASPIVFQIGETYTAQARIKGTNGHQVRFQNNQVGVGSIYSSYATLTGGWDLVTWTFVAQSATGSLEIKALNSGQAFNVDGVQLEMASVPFMNRSATNYPAAQVPTTTINFVDGTAGGSVTDPGHYGGFIFGKVGSVAALMDSSVYKTSPASFKISTTATGSYIEARLGGVNNYWGAYGQRVNPGHTYSFSVWIKTNVVSGDSNSGAYVNLILSDTNGAAVSQEVTTTPVKTTQDWTLHSFSFTAHRNAAWIHPEMRIYGHNGAGTLIMDAWFDELNLVHTSPEPLNYFDGGSAGAGWRGTAHGSQSYTNTFELAKTHTTNALKRKANVASHATDANKRKATLVLYTTDANKRRANTKTHTTDALKRKLNTLTHTTSANKRVSGFLKTHATDANKRKALTVQHTTSANLRKVTTTTHSTDASLSRSVQLTHSTDALKRVVSTVAHSTDTYIVNRRSVSHSTSAYLNSQGGVKKVLVDGTWHTGVVKVLDGSVWVVAKVNYKGGSGWQESQL